MVKKIGSSEVPFNDISRRFQKSDNLLAEIKDLILKGPYLNGPQLDSFEMNFAKYLSAKHSIGVSSGTSALQLAMLALNLPTNSFILLPANAGGYSTIAALNAKLSPVFYDVDENGLINIDGLANFSNSNISAIVATHLYGQTVNMIKLLEYTKKQEWKTIEDCAQSTGSVYQSKKSGTFADIAAFSFYPTKNLGAIGDAGAVVTNDDNLAIRVRELREYGWSSKYEVRIKHGGNHRMDEIQALILNKQLDSLDSNNIKRREIWKYYSSIIDHKNSYLLGTNDETFVAHLAVLKTENRDMLKNFLSERKIQTQIHYPIPDHKQIGWNFDKINHLRNTEVLSTKILSLPLFPEMYDHEIDFVAESVKEWLKSV